jgi:hypothetical protein
MAESNSSPAWREALVRLVVKRLDANRLRVYPAAIALTVVATWLVSMALGPGMTDLAGNVVGSDFAAFYTGGRFLLDGRMDELYDFGAQKAFQDSLVHPVRTTEMHPYINPPFAAALYAAFAWCSYGQGVIVWYGAGFACLVGAVWLVQREMTAPGGPGPRRLVILSLCFFPTLAWLIYGQNATLTLFLFTLMFVQLRRQRDFAGGLALGLLFYKPQLMIACGVMLLVRGRWRALAGVTAGVALWTALGVALCPEAMLTYADVSPQLFDFLRAEGTFLGAHIEFPSWGSHSFYGFCILLTDGLSHRVTDVLAGGMTILGLVWVAMVWRHQTWRVGSRSWDLTVAATVAIGLLISPHLFVYDLTTLLLPLMVAACHFRGAGGRPLDGGPLLATASVLYAVTYLSSYLSWGQLQVTEMLGVPAVALQLSTPVVALWSWTLVRTARGSAAQHGCCPRVLAMGV